MKLSFSFNSAHNSTQKFSRVPTVLRVKNCYYVCRHFSLENGHKKSFANSYDKDNP